MPTFVGKPFSSYFKNLLGIDQASNTGTDTVIRKVQDGSGQDTAISISNRKLVVQGTQVNTTATLDVQNITDGSILSVDTTNSRVLVGASQVHATTLYKEMGLYDSWLSLSINSK